MGGNQTTTSSQTAVPAIKGASKGLKGILKQAQGIPPTQPVQGIQGFSQDLLNAGRTGVGTMEKTAAGGFLDQENPYLQGILGNLNEQARTAVGGEFANAGRSVGGQYENALVKALTNAQAPYLFNNYQFERGNQNNASQFLTGGAPGLVAGTSALPYAGLQGLSNLMLPIAAGGGTRQTGTQTQGGNALQQGIGAGMGTAGLLGNTGAFGAGGWLGPMMAGMMPFL